MSEIEYTPGNGADRTPAPPVGVRELVVVTKPELRLRARADGLSAAPGQNPGPIADILSRHGAILQPLFGNEDRTDRKVAAMPAPEGVPDLTVFYHVEAQDDELDKLAEELLALESVDAAYVKPAGSPPVMLDPLAPPAERLNSMMPASPDAPPVTADFAARQLYLDAAPGGIDARYAWTVAGGGGSGVRIIDCEWGWRFTHEDLLQNQGGVVAGTATTDVDFVNHGTAVMGEIGGDNNSEGIIGIAPDAVFSGSSFNDQTTSQAITAAADQLGAGDIILLEIHRPGPNTPNPQQGQLGFIAIEWWPDDFAAIRYAVGKGIVVVEAAGNGFQNLDDAVYSVRPNGFPSSWQNPFNPANPSSGAVVVGAGAPPAGTHGADWGPDRSRLDFSNFGARVDVQGWGREVTSTGYGDLQGGSSADLWYTDRFSGTSSASPIIVGALACIQGTLLAAGLTRLTPARAQDLLRAYGSPQQDAPGRPASQRIGNRPDLRQLITAALVGGGLYEYGAPYGADLTGDGRADIVGFGDAGVYVSLNNGNGTFGGLHRVIDNFAYSAGGWRIDKHPRVLADLTGDGRADIVGFGDAAVYVSLNNGNGTFGGLQRVVDNFAYSAGGWRVGQHPRFLADLTGDGRADIVGFGDGGVWVSLNNGNGTFGPVHKVIDNFAYSAGGWRVEKHPRFLADLTGDGRADIVGFGDAGVYVALNNGDGTFGPLQLVVNNFGYEAGGWRVDKHPRFLADLTGDGRADILGFGYAGAYVSLNQGNGTFGPVQFVVNNFGYDAGGWRNEMHPRFLADLTGDGRADILGFGYAGAYVSLNQGNGNFGPVQFVVNNFGYDAGGWRTEMHPRFLADATGDGRADILGFGYAGVWESLNQGNGTFPGPQLVVNDFGYNAGGWRVDKHPRVVVGRR